MGRYKAYGRILIITINGEGDGKVKVSEYYWMKLIINLSLWCLCESDFTNFIFSGMNIKKTTYSP